MTPAPDHGGLVADDVHAVEEVGPPVRVAYVDPVHVLGHATRPVRAPRG